TQPPDAVQTPLNPGGQFRSCAAPGVVAWAGPKFAPGRSHPRRDTPRTPPTPPAGSDRGQPRRQWLAAAADAFGRMSAAAGRGRPVTSLRRETRAGSPGDGLAARPLERHVSSGPHARPTDE